MWGAQIIICAPKAFLERIYMYIVIDMLNIIYALITSLAYNDFTMAFFYIIFVLIFFKMFKDLLWHYS